VFNVADASISVGVGIIILFQSSIFKEHKKEEAQPTQSDSSENGDENPEVKDPA
jgi:hypothetical protein